MPTPALERSVAELRPDLVLIGSLNRERATDFLASPPAIGSTPIVLGGVGFHPEDAALLPGAVVHHGTISQLPATLARALTSRAGAFG
jgi:hypothetical protein